MNNFYGEIAGLLWGWWWKKRDETDVLEYVTQVGEVVFSRGRRRHGGRGEQRRLAAGVLQASGPAWSDYSHTDESHLAASQGPCDPDDCKDNGAGAQRIHAEPFDTRRRLFPLSFSCWPRAPCPPPPLFAPLKGALLTGSPLLAPLTPWAIFFLNPPFPYSPQADTPDKCPPSNDNLKTILCSPFCSPNRCLPNPYFLPGTLRSHLCRRRGRELCSWELCKEPSNHRRQTADCSWEGTCEFL